MGTLDDHGSTLRATSFERFAVAEVLMPPGLELENHHHDSAQICFVLEGSYEESWDDSPQRLEPGSILFRPASTRHSNRFSAEEVLALLVSFRDRCPTTPAPRRLPETIFADLRNELIRELRRDDDSAWALEGLALLLGARVARWLDHPDMIPPVWLQEARSIVDRKFGDSISLTSIAEMVDVHRTTLAAGFRRWYQTSVGEAIRRRRIQEAVTLLRESAIPISAIAIDCGFHDQSHLTRTLKQHLGATPLEIRRGR